MVSSQDWDFPSGSKYREVVYSVWVWEEEIPDEK